MKSFFIGLLIVVLNFSVAIAQVANSVFLACDPDPEAFEYVIEMDGSEIFRGEPLEYDGTDSNGKPATIIVDIKAEIEPDALHLVRAKAVNAWGDESEWTDPLEFTYSSRKGGAIFERKQVQVPAMLRIL